MTRPLAWLRTDSNWLVVASLLGLGALAFGLLAAVFAGVGS